MNDVKLITVKEASKYLRLPLSRIYQLVRVKAFPSIQMGGSWRIDQNQLDSWVKSEILKK